MEVPTHSAEETRRFAARLGSRLMPDSVVLIRGDLGAGKTTFVQGLAEGLGVGAAVTSPTFTLVHEYHGGRLPLYHFDLYRLGSAEEVFDLGFADYLEQGGVVAVEWPERLEDSAPAECLTVVLTASGEDGRTIRLAPHGPQYERAVQELEAEP